MKSAIDAVPMSETKAITVDVQQAAVAALGVHDLLHRPEHEPIIVALAKLGTLDRALIDGLADIARAAWYARHKVLVTSAVHPEAALPVALLEQALECRSRMRKALEYNLEGDVRATAILARLRLGTGHIDLANDLLGYADMYREHAAAIQDDKKNYRGTDEALACKLSAEVTAALGVTATPEQTTWKSYQARAFVLLRRHYDEAARLGHFLFLRRRGGAFPLALHREPRCAHVSREGRRAGRGRGSGSGRRARVAQRRATSPPAGPKSGRTGGTPHRLQAFWLLSRGAMWFAGQMLARLVREARRAATAITMRTGTGAVMDGLELWFDGGESSLSVRRFEVREAISELFEVTVTAVSPDEQLALESLVNAPARLRVQTHLGTRIWQGLVRATEVGAAEPSGLSTYTVTIVPALWALTQRQNSRIFQHLSVPEIADALLGEWGIEPVWRVDRSASPKLEMRVQYEESDHAFLCRLLEEAGISFMFENHLEQGTVLVLHDRPNAQEPCLPAPIAFVASAGQAQAGRLGYVTKVEIGREVRPGKVTIRDHDFRRPAFTLESEAAIDEGPEVAYEQYAYAPGAFLIEKNPGTGPTPADEKGIARHNLDAGTALAKRMLRGERQSKEVVFETNVLELHPGAVFAMTGHPRADLAADRALLVTSFALAGEVGKEWTMRGTAVPGEKTYRPPRRMPKPRIDGVQSAIVVGPPAEPPAEGQAGPPAAASISTDEFGRVRVQFPWDRYGSSDPNSSCWMRVSQGWAGPAYGLTAVPRVGHEVLVAFTEGDPDQPVVVGSVHNAATPVPYPLPANETVSTWKSRSVPSGEGGNELRFEDAKGREHLYLQAERDLHAVVKHDLLAVVGHKRTVRVGNDAREETIGDRTKVVLGREVDVVVEERRTVVAGDRRVEVSGRDTALVGSKFLVKVMPELAGLLAPPPEATASAAAENGAANGTNGVPAAPPNGAPAAPAVTSGLLMVDKKIVLTTRDATIVLDGPNITVASSFIVAAPTVTEADAFKQAALAAQAAARQAAAEAAAKQASLPLGAAPANLPPDPVRLVIKDAGGKVLQTLTIDRSRLSSSLSPGLRDFLRSGDPVEMYTDRDYGGANVGAVLSNLGPGAILQSASVQSSAGGMGAGGPATGGALPGGATAAAAGAPPDEAHIVMLDAEGNPKRTVTIDRNRLSPALSPGLLSFLRTGEPVQMRMDQLFDGVSAEGVIAGLGPGAVLEDTPFVQKIDQDTFRTYRDADVRVITEFDDHRGEGKYRDPEAKKVATVYVNLDKVPADLKSVFKDKATTLDVNATHNGLPYRDFYKKLEGAGAVVERVERPEETYRSDNDSGPGADELLFVGDPDDTPGWERHLGNAMESRDLEIWHDNGAPQASWTYEAGIISTNNQEGDTRTHVFTGNFSQLSKKGLLADGFQFKGEEHWAGADRQIYVLSSDVRTEGGPIHLSNMNNTTDGPYGFLQVDGLVLQPGGEKYVTFSEKNGPTPNGLEILKQHGQTPPQPPRDFWIRGRDSDGGRRRFVHFDADGSVLAELSDGEMLGFNSSYVPTEQLSLPAEQQTRVEGLSGKIRDPIQKGELFSTLRQVLGLASIPLSFLVPGSGLVTGAFLAAMSGDPLQMAFAGLSMFGAAAAAPGGLPGIGANFGNYVNAARNAYNLATADSKLPALLSFVGSSVNLDGQNPLTSAFFSAAADVTRGIENPSFETLLNAVAGIAGYARAIEQKQGVEAARQAIQDPTFQGAIYQLVTTGKLPAGFDVGTTGTSGTFTDVSNAQPPGTVVGGTGAKDDLEYISGSSGTDIDFLSDDWKDPFTSTRQVPSGQLDPALGSGQPVLGPGMDADDIHAGLDSGKLKLALEQGPEMSELLRNAPSAGENGMLFSGPALSLMDLMTNGDLRFSVSADVNSLTSEIAIVRDPLTGQEVVFDPTGAEDPASLPTLDRASPGSLVSYLGKAYYWTEDGTHLVAVDGSEAIPLTAQGRNLLFSADADGSPPPAGYRPPPGENLLIPRGSPQSETSVLRDYRQGSSPIDGVKGIMPAYKPDELMPVYSLGERSDAARANKLFGTVRDELDQGGALKENIGWDNWMQNDSAAILEKVVHLNVNMDWNDKNSDYSVLSRFTSRHGNFVTLLECDDVARYQLQRLLQHAGQFNYLEAQVVTGWHNHSVLIYRTSPNGRWIIPDAYYQLIANDRSSINAIPPDYRNNLDKNGYPGQGFAVNIVRIVNGRLKFGM